jgi:hypothetical protein
MSLDRLKDSSVSGVVNNAECGGDIDADADVDADEDELQACDPDSWRTHLAAGTLPAGHCADRDPMSLNLAPISYEHRPLSIYLGVHGLGFCASLYLRWLGFERHSDCRVPYWYRRAQLSPEELQRQTARADPLVLIHGIGIGAFTYLHLLRDLYTVRNANTCSQRSMYLLDLSYVSMRLGADDVPSPLEHVASITAMLHRHEMAERAHYDARTPARSAQRFWATPTMPTLEEVQQSATPIKALFVSHSYGTFVSGAGACMAPTSLQRDCFASARRAHSMLCVFHACLQVATWVVKHASHCVSSSIFIDPVCFMVSDTLSPQQK